MSTKSLTLTIPSPLARELDLLGRELVAEILQRGLLQWRIEQALERYASGGMSFAAAAERVGIPQSELARHAYARGMEPRSSAETLTEELA